MTSLVTLAEYQRITRDFTSDSSDVLEQLDAAEHLIAEYLRRPGRLQSGTYTDRLRLYSAENIDGGYNGAYVCYPLATPVASVAGGLTVLSPRSIAGAFPDDGPFLEGITGQGVQPYATVTYTGGWTAETLPETVRREIARAARAALTAPATAVPAGATSVRTGDVAVTFGNAADVGADLTGAARRALRPYMRRRGA